MQHGFTYSLTICITFYVPASQMSGATDDALWGDANTLATLQEVKDAQAALKDYVTMKISYARLY